MVRHQGEVDRRLKQSMNKATHLNNILLHSSFASKGFKRPPLCQWAHCNFGAHKASRLTKLPSLSFTKTVRVQPSHKQVVEQGLRKPRLSTSIYRVTEGSELITRGCKELVTSGNGVIIDRKPREFGEGADHALVRTLGAFLSVA